MRFIGNLPSEMVAKMFSDILLSDGIEHQVESDGGGWGVWVRSEDDFDRASKRLAAYLRVSEEP